MRPIWIALAVALALSTVWMSQVPDYVYRRQVSIATTYADTALADCRAAHVEDTTGIECKRLSAIAFDAALDPIVRLSPTWGPTIYAAVALMLIWAMAGGIALSIDWLRRGFGLWRSA
ncbi:hypothetical protein SAMN02745126_05470 [Enhydrobacter aerosaccus]|uniref:Uncharacterized protein n=1 Tax=Enhydrobacter aerosaccus TaxID=225324 RepID=A0A1T4T0T7_9HYPH|nr:hypothetical protein [Enhydrobacter aerosaccus]SKA34073.1 hypothetical protein SAMN02745126_05470 [Enhydrobacter aerosaccus]